MRLALWTYTLALFYAVWSNNHFGRNLTPGSDAELITDGMVLIMVTIGLLIQAVERAIK